MNSAFAPSEVFMRYSGPSSVSALSPSARPESYLGSSSLNTPEEVAGPVVETLQRSERLEADAEQQARSEPPVLVIGHATAPSVLVIPPSPIPAQQSGSVAMADFEPEAPRANVEDLLVATYGDGPGSTDDTLLQVPVVQWPPRGSEVDAQDLQPARALERFVMPAPSLSPPVTMNSQRLRSKPRFALTFPDLVPSDCEVQPDLNFIFFITILFYFPSITIFELLSVKDGGMKPGHLAGLQEKMNRPGALMPVIGIILGIELSYMLYMHGHNLCFAMADKLSNALLPVLCNDRYCIM